MYKVGWKFFNDVNYGRVIFLIYDLWILFFIFIVKIRIDILEIKKKDRRNGGWGIFLDKFDMVKIFDFILFFVLELKDC